MSMRFCSNSQPRLGNSGTAPDDAKQRAVIVTPRPRLVQQTEQEAKDKLSPAAYDLFEERVCIVSTDAFKRGRTKYSSNTLVIFDESHTFTDFVTKKFEGCDASVCITATPKYRWPYEFDTQTRMTKQQADMATFKPECNTKPLHLKVEHTRVLCRIDKAAKEACSEMVSFIMKYFGMRTNRSTYKRQLKIARSFFEVAGPQSVTDYDVLVKLTKQRYMTGPKRNRELKTMEELEPTTQSLQPSCDVCCICLDGLQSVNHTTVQLHTCAHITHKSCYEEYCSIRYGSNRSGTVHLAQCPLCRQSVTSLARAWFADSTKTPKKDNEVRETAKLLLPQSKLDKFEEVLRQVESGTKIVVYATKRLWHFNIIQAIGSIAIRNGATITACGFKGESKNAKQIAKTISKFKQTGNGNPATSILVLSQEKYAEGLDFVLADELWMLYPSMTTTQFRQCSGRVVRYGRTKDVKIRYFCTECSIETYIVNEKGEIHNMSDPDSDNSISSLYSLVFYLALECGLLANIPSHLFKNTSLLQLQKLLSGDVEVLKVAMKNATFEIDSISLDLQALDSAF
jgi:hypothetical protein